MLYFSCKAGCSSSAGFDVADAIALLRLDDLYVEVFEVKDVKVSSNAAVTDSEATADMFAAVQHDCAACWLDSA